MLARGIHPVLLNQEGLASALGALAERAPLPVVVSAPTTRFGERIETTAYFLVSEAVTVEVSDDGVGGADESGGGTGQQGMRDRVTAVGGHITVSSSKLGGTTIVAGLPCG